MFRTGSAIVAITLLVALLPLPSASAFPAYTDDVFTWKHTNTEPGSSAPLAQAQCRALSPDLDPDASACTILEYHIGNSDSHVFFRWVLQTTDFGQLGEAGGRVRLEQTFGGSLPESPFSFSGELTAAGTVTTFASDPADWKDAVEWEVAGDTVVAALPIGLVGTRLAGGAAVGSYFNITLGAQPTTRVFATSENTASQTADILAGITETNQKFELRAWGSLQAPPSGPESILEDVVGFPVERTFTFTDPTSEIRRFNWSMNGTAFVLQYTVAATNGSAAIALKDTAGAAVFDGSALTGSANRSIAAGAAGNWTLDLVFEEFVGTLSFVLRLPAPGGEISDDGIGGDGNGTGSDDTGEVPPEKGAPGPGLFVLMAVLGAVAVALRRRT